MAKKYLSLDEAATKLGVSADVLRRAREKGDLRGFADRGNWKFREEDLEEFGRTLQTTSDPEIPLLSPDLELDFSDESNQSVFSGDDDDDIGEQPTIIRKAGDSNVLSEESDLNLFGVDDEGASDSSVRLMLDDALVKPSESSKIKAGKNKQVLSDSSNVIGKKSGSDSSRILTDEESSKDIPISFNDSSTDQKLEGSSVDIAISFGDSSQELALALEDDDDGDGNLVLGGDSDSDVRLASDDANLSDSNSEIVLGSSDSDSDVRLLDKTQPMRLDPDSDSDVRLIKTDSDSDVRLVGNDSDSDVRLLPARRGARPDSDSDVSLAGSDADIPLAIADSDDEDLSGDGFVIGEGSDIKLGSDSGIKLETGGDSGISLDIAEDSGIALDTGTDSDISLAIGGDDDDGITLDTAGDSGIALDLPDDSGLSLDGASMEATAPLIKMSGRKKAADDSATLVQMPAFDAGDEGDESDTDFELGALEGDSGSSDTSVLLFDDEDDADDRGATMIKKKDKVERDETFDLEGGDEFEDDEASEELVGEDDELEDEGGEDFLADDEDFESEDDSMGGSVDASAAATVKYVQVEQEWGGFVFGASLVSALLMVLAAGVMIDLVRYNWRAGEYGVVAGPLIKMLSQ